MEGGETMSENLETIIIFDEVAANYLARLHECLKSSEMHTREYYYESGNLRRLPFAKLVASVFDQARGAYRVTVSVESAMLVQKGEAEPLEELAVPLSAIERIFESVGRAFPYEQILQ